MSYLEKRIGKNKYACELTGNGEPLVLLHGFTGSSKTWEPFVHKWSSVFRVITIDLPGHGNSVTPDFPTMIDFCDELKILLEELQVSKCHLLGYSMGGRVALSFAQRHPEMVSSLILESASPGLKTESERVERKEKDAKLADNILQNGLEAFVDEWESLPMFSTQKMLPDDAKATIRKERLAQSPTGLAGSLTYMGTGNQPSWWNRLSSIKVPVLLVVGGLDSKFVTINQEMEKQFNYGELIIVHDASHAVHIEQAEKFVTIVMEFLYLKNN